MKITKTFVSIFLVTFLIGYVSVLSVKKTSAPRMPVKLNFENHDYLDFSKVKPDLTQEIPSPAPQPKFEPEIFDIPDYSEDDEIPKYKVKLMDITETGNSFRKEEIEEAKSGETWFGLFREKGGFYLHKTKIKIRLEGNPNRYGEDSQTIKLSRQGKPVFLLKNAENLNEGRIETLFRSLSYDEADRLGKELKPMKIGFVRQFKLGGKIYTLEVKAGLTKSNEKISVLILKSGNKSQILYFNMYFDAGDNIGNLLWVGDLDKDGKLDLYMDFYDFEKGGFESGLFLSSEAEKDNLVKQVAGFGTPGC